VGVGSGFQTYEGLAAIDVEVDIAVRLGEGGIVGRGVVSVFEGWKERCCILDSKSSGVIYHHIQLSQR
jgi:hypothetical protein